MRQYLSAILILLMASTLSAQDSSQYFQPQKVKFFKRNFLLKASYQGGPVLQTNDFVKGVNSTNEAITQFNAFSIELARQADGSKEWHHRWSFPEWGIGYYQADYGRANDLGQPAAVYAFMNSPFHRWGRFGLFYEVGFGLTWNWKPYDPEINPWNVAIGSYNTVYIDAGIKAKYMIGNHFDINLGWSFTHFSNGASSLPNSGINQSGVKAGLAYHFQKNRVETKKKILPEFDGKHEISLSIKGAVKQVKFDTSITGLKTEYLGLNYGVFISDIMYQYHAFPLFKFGGGIDFVYDGSTTAQLDVVDGVYNPVKTPAEYHMNLSVYGSVEIVVSRVSLLIQPGYYVVRREIPGQTPDFYQRVLARIEIYDGLYFTGGLRAYNFGVADYIEWGLGYRLRK